MQDLAGDAEMKQDDSHENVKSLTEENKDIEMAMTSAETDKAPKKILATPKRKGRPPKKI